MTRVLVPVAILEGGSVSAGLVDLLSTVDVTVLGYHELPEQTPPDQARLQFEDRATGALEDITEEFRNAGGDADFRLVFTHDRKQSIDRVAAETGTAAYAITGATGDVDRLLVSLNGDVSVDAITGFVTGIVGDRAIGVTLLVAGDGADDGRLETTAERLREANVDTETRRAENAPFDALFDAVPGHDAIVMGEQAPSLSSLLLGEQTERIADASVGPVLVVRAPDEEQPDA